MAAVPPASRRSSNDGRQSLSSAKHPLPATATPSSLTAAPAQRFQTYAADDPELAASVQAAREGEGRSAGEETAGKGPRRRRRSSAPLPGAGEAVQRASASTEARAAAGARDVRDMDRLLPPFYGKPSRPSSPDVLATLLRPVLASYSRPSSQTQPSPHRRTAPSTLLETPPEPAAPAAPAASSLPAHFPPREPTDPAPTVESQGFVLYVGSLVAYVAYLLWAVLPGDWLERAGVGWYPSQEWALLVPAWVVMLVVFTYTSYFFLNMYNTPPLSSSALLCPSPSSKAFVAPPLPSLLPDGSLAPNPLFAHSVLLADDAIPPLYDLPQEWVDRVLFGGEEQEDDGEKREEG